MTELNLFPLISTHLTQSNLFVCFCSKPSLNHKLNVIVALRKFNKDDIKSNIMINRLSFSLRTSPLLRYIQILFHLKKEYRCTVYPYQQTLHREVVATTILGAFI